MLTLQILSLNPTLNNFTTLSTYAFESGSDCEVFVRIHNQQLNLRYIPLEDATLETTLVNADDSTISPAFTNPFPEDRSIFRFELTAAETQLLVGQDLKVILTEDDKKTVITLRKALSKTGGGCC